MRKIYLNADVRFRYNEQVWRILRVFDDEVEVESQSFHNTAIFKKHQLISWLDKGDLVFETTNQNPEIVDIKDVSIEIDPKLLSIARFRLFVIEPLLELQNPTMKDVENRIEEVNNQILNNEFSNIVPLNKVSVSTAYRWINTYRSHDRDNLSLIPKYYNSGGKGKRRFDNEIEVIIQNFINDCYKNGITVDIKDIHAFVETKIQEKRTITNRDIKTPSYPTFTRIVNEIPEAELVLTRRGNKGEAEKFGYTQQGPRPEIPLERVEIDSTQIDLPVIDEVDFKVIGRPYLTCATDKCTGNLLGFCLDFTPPGWPTLMDTLRHCLMDKSYVADKYPMIKNNWNAYGVPSKVVVDNGPEYHSDAFQDACFQLGFRIQLAPRRTPKWKGSIERFLKTINFGVAHKIPGSTGSNILQRGDEDPFKEACIPLSILIMLIHLWVIDIYSQDVNRGVGGIPSKLWEHKCKLHPIPWPDSTKELPVLLGRVGERLIRAKGIELKGLFYNSRELNKLLNSFSKNNNGYNQKFKIKWDPWDISNIHVCDHINENWLKVPAVDQDYTHNLTEWEHDRIREVARKQFAQVDIIALSQAKTLFFSIVASCYSQFHGGKTGIAHARGSGTRKELFGDSIQPIPMLSTNKTPNIDITSKFNKKVKNKPISNKVVALDKQSQFNSPDEQFEISFD